jgi:hydrogenase maturation protease
VSVLLIGIGNPLRGDDGTGIIAAQRLHAAWTSYGFPHRLLIVHQLLPELAEDLGAATDQSGPHAAANIRSPTTHEFAVRSVLFVDADTMAQSREAGYSLRAVSVYGEDSSALGAPSRAGMTHHLGPETLLGYTAALFPPAPRGWILSIPGANFELGAPLSVGARAAITQIEGEAAKIWRIITLQRPSLHMDHE